MTRLIRLASANTPRHTVNKPQIVPPAAQASGLRRVLLAQQVDSCGAAEAHTALRRELKDGPYLVSAARANDVFPNTRIGNSVLTLTYGPHRWDRLDKMTLNLDWSGRDHGLNMSVVLSERERDGQTLTTIAGHLPHKGDISDAGWFRLAGQCREFAEDIPGAVGLLFDWNRNRRYVAEAFPRAAGWQVAMGGVSGAAVRGLEVRRERQVVDGYWPHVSDHREGLIVTVCAVTDERRVRRLPRH